MLVGDKIIYLELHKTGSTHTRKVLRELFSDESKVIGKHNLYSSVFKNDIEEFHDKLKLGNIRNPWDWYVSLWAYGCMNKGGLFNRVTQPPKIFSMKGIETIMKRIYFKKPLFQNMSKWKYLYSDVNNQSNFREWLKQILVKTNISIGENYKESKISSIIGLLTFRYIKLYTYEGKKMLSKFDDFNSVKEHDRHNNFIDLIIKKESIHDSLISYANDLGLEESRVKEILKDFSKKTNYSKHKGYREYYDEETRSIVGRKEKLLIEKYNYRL